MKSDYSDIDTINIEEGETWYPNHPYVDDKGIWNPLSPYSRYGTCSEYKMIISKEMFIEAYNKYIRDDTSSDSNKKAVY